MTVEFNHNPQQFREILKIDFNDQEEYLQFVKDLAQAILMDFQLSDEFEEDVAYELITRHREKLAEDILDKLIERAIKNRPAIKSQEAKAGR